MPPLPQGEDWGESLYPLSHRERAGESLMPPLPQGEGWGEGI